ncbi:E3 ubiquitin-protein ligase LRSAM1 [Echinococcus granulosus]|uniref:E3 ubiquitin-protein ligase LRSAM1 n=1 Tax=Echinococcus granulosus TaxID=6210 RepID=W6U9M0_ECHGR|nr:E3 ubiquitin-protein ligase LRSAM1 [Echinococcus granulosus]EUB57216.1 E3 ubiquitin-protein ligase LRSAM1 [Echinococcus granulosus]
MYELSQEAISNMSHRLNASKKLLILHSNLLHPLFNAEKVADLPHLTHLDLHSNKFRLFPNEVFSMPLLNVLDLSFNEIRVVPDRIGLLTRIKHLNLEENCIQNLSSTIGYLHTLEEPCFDQNPITRLPVALENLKQLKNTNFPLSSITLPSKDVYDFGSQLCSHFFAKVSTFIFLSFDLFS